MSSDTTSNKVVIVDGLHKSFKRPLEKSSGIKQLILNMVQGKVDKGYDTQRVLKDISFDIEEGDFYGIVGRNGSGKSTLLKLLAGIYQPDSGHITTKGSLIPFIELGVGFNPELTGRENVFLNGALLGFSRSDMEGMYDEIVEFAELSEFMGQKLKNYSSGMQVRLAFSIAIRAKSDILVLDEVLAVGDEAFQKKCNTFFNEIKKDKKKTVILVTHSMDAVRRYCNKAILIEKGVVIAEGDPNEVADSYSKQFIVNKPTTIKKKNRYGTGEVVYENMQYDLQKDVFRLEFDIVNKTKQSYNDITMGFDFCINDEIVIGNDTRFIEEYKNGIQLDARKKKHMVLEFKNDFGKHQFTLNTNITTGLGMNVTDHMRPALKFDSNNIRYSDAWKIISHPNIKSDDSKKS